MLAWSVKLISLDYVFSSFLTSNVLIDIQGQQTVARGTMQDDENKSLSVPCLRAYQESLQRPSKWRLTSRKYPLSPIWNHAGALAESVDPVVTMRIEIKLSGRDVGWVKLVSEGYPGPLPSLMYLSCYGVENAYPTDIVPSSWVRSRFRVKVPNDDFE